MNVGMDMNVIAIMDIQWFPWTTIYYQNNYRMYIYDNAPKSILSTHSSFTNVYHIDKKSPLKERFLLSEETFRSFAYQTYGRTLPVVKHVLVASSSEKSDAQLNELHSEWNNKEPPRQANIKPKTSTDINPIVYMWTVFKTRPGNS